MVSKGILWLNCSMSPPPSFRENQSFLLQKNDQQLSCVLKSFRLHQDNWLLSLDCFQNPEEVSPWNGALVLFPKDALNQLEPGEFYLEDLIGYMLKDRQGQNLGTLVAFEGNGDLLFWKIKSFHHEFILPANNPWVVSIHHDQREIRVDLPDGLYPSQ